MPSITSYVWLLGYRPVWFPAQGAIGLLAGCLHLVGGARGLSRLFELPASFEGVFTANSMDGDALPRPALEAAG
jgi:hypothetical protein